MVNLEVVLKRWKEYFEKLMNEENNRDPRTEEPEVANEEVNCVRRGEVKNALKRMKKDKASPPLENPMLNKSGNVMVNLEVVLKRWKEYFEKLINEENNRDPRIEEPEVANEEVNYVSREEVKNALKRMKKDKASPPLENSMLNNNN